MRALSLVLCLLLTSCSHIAHDEEDHLATGDRVNLLRPVKVEALYSHIIFQDGEIITQVELKPYQTSCILDVNDLGPSEYEAEEFSITRINYYDEMYSDTGAVVRYFTEFVLSSEQREKPFVLTCQALGDTMQYQNFPIPDIQQAVGSYFKI